MKFIEFPQLNYLSDQLTYESAECKVHTRLEAYSCKSIGREKKMFKALEHTYAEENAYNLSISPPEDAAEALASPFGPLDKHSSRKVLYLLIATLNVAFPDHNFAELRPDAFRKEESPANVVHALSTTLLSLRPSPNSIAEFNPRSYSSYPPSSDTFPSTSSPSTSYKHLKKGEDVLAGTHPTFYHLLDEIIKLKECDVYSYSPGKEWDPHEVDSDDEDAMSDDMSTSSYDGAFDFEPDDASPYRPSSRSRRSDAKRSRPYDDEEDWHIPTSRPRFGGLLWSSNWFFHNKNQKRILFVSVWARKKLGRWYARDGYEDWEESMRSGLRA